MIPASYLSPQQASTILNTLKLGFGTYQSSSATAADLGINGWSVIPSLRDIPADLVGRVLSTDLSSSTSTISTTGLAQSSIDKLNGIRNRLPSAMTALYDDQNTPLQNPYHGLTVGTSAYNHVTDAIINTIFRFDSRYLLRKRSPNTVGPYGENTDYELPSAFQMTNHPMIVGRLKPHGFTDVTNIDDTGTDGAYRITTSSNHGYYSGQSIATTGVNVAATTVQEYPEIVSLSQQLTTGLIADVAPTSKFIVTGGQNFINGQAVVTDGQTGWGIFDWQPRRYVKRLSSTEVELYRDSALTDKIVPGFGDIIGVYKTTYNNMSTMAVQTNGTHLMFDDLPQIIDGTDNFGPFEKKTITSVDFSNGLWSTFGAGYSIVDGQITNIGGAGSNGWQNVNNTNIPLYFKKVNDTHFSLYYDEALTQLCIPGVTADGDGQLAGFTVSGGNYSVTIDLNTPLISGQSVYFANTNTDFSVAPSITNYNASTNIFTLGSAHRLEDGQPVHIGSTITIGGSSYAVPALWAKTAGLTSTQVKLYTNSALTSLWVPTSSGGTVTDATLTMAFYAKYNTSTKFDLYVDAAMTNPYNQSVSISGYSGGYIGVSKHVVNLSPPSGSYIQPMFYCHRDGYDRATLWANKTRTLAFPYFYTNGTVDNIGVAVPGVVSVDLTEINPQLVLDSYGLQTAPPLSLTTFTTTGIYRINGIGYYDTTDGFTSNLKALDGHLKPVYWAKKITAKVVELYVDEALTVPVKSGGTGPNAPAIVTPATSGAFEITWFDQYRYRLSTIDCINIGGERYYYNDYSVDASNPVVGVDARWQDRTDGSNFTYKFFTDHNTSNRIGTLPTITVYEYSSTSAGAYYGMMRKTAGSGSVTDTGPRIIDPTVYGGIGSPVVYTLEFPGQFQYDTEFLFGINSHDQVGTYVADPLKQTGDIWVVDDNVGNAGSAGNSAQYARLWPTHIQPATLTWSIEQPNQVLESQNFTRYVRGKDITQYRIKMSYSPMTMEQFRPFLNIITAARGGFKPVRFTPPHSAYKNGSVTINVHKRNATTPSIVRGRVTVQPGQQIIKLDGLPPNLTNAYSAGHALEISQQNSMGGWALPIHDVWTNEYGEANIRVNNSLTQVMDFGVRIFSDAFGLDCFIDTPTIDIKVDTLGYHYFDIDLITKRIF